MKMQSVRHPGLFLLLGLAGLPFIHLLVTGTLIWIFALILNFSDAASTIASLLALAYFPAVIAGEVLIIRKYQAMKKEMKTT